MRAARLTCRQCAGRFWGGGNVAFCSAECRREHKAEYQRAYQRRFRKTKEGRAYRRDWQSRRRLDPDYRAR